MSEMTLDFLDRKWQSLTTSLMRMSEIFLISLKNQGLRATNHIQAKLMGYLWATLMLLEGFLKSRLTVIKMTKSEQSATAHVQIRVCDSF